MTDKQENAMSGYRPNRSQQFAILAELRSRGLCEHDTIIVHHVLVDTPLKMVVQLESYNPPVDRKYQTEGTPEALYDPMSARCRPRFFRIEL